MPAEIELLVIGPNLPLGGRLVPIALLFIHVYFGVVAVDGAIHFDAVVAMCGLCGDMAITTLPVVGWYLDLVNIRKPQGAPI